MLVLSRTRISIALVLGLAALLVASLVGPASAKGRPDHAGGKAAPAVTEDNDNNDGNTRNNVVDDGDNAHPSGKDRSVEHGRSGNQGKAKADPDNNGKGPDRSNGGVDQPGRNGGTDKADQDGNNGCGNDDDFEDDNEGRCGGAKPSTDRPDKPSKPSKPGKPSKPSKPTTPTKPTKPTKPSKPSKPSKVNICHATGSTTNPYVFINVSTNAIKGHSGHSGDVIGAASAAACPGTKTPPTEPPVDGPKDPVKPPKGDPKDDGDVGGVIIVRPPVDTDDNDDKPRPPADEVIRDLPAPDRVLASTGSRTSILASIAALTLLLGAGLLGFRRFAQQP
jgi:LPXTG-motif cell wall-anchored protein